MYKSFDKVSDDVLCQAVRRHLSCGDDDLSVTSSDWHGDGSNVGDGLTSVIKAVRVNYKLKGLDDSLELIAKLKVKTESGESAAASDSKLGNWWDAMHLFERETEFYSRAMPAIEKAAEERGQPRPEVVGVLHCEEGGAHVVMENLKTRGFRLIHDVDAKFRWALNEQQMHMILKELSRFHAASYHFVRGHPGGRKGLAESLPFIGAAAKNGQFMTTDPEVVAQNKETYLKVTRQMVPTLRECASKEVADRFEKSLPDLAEICGRSRDAEGHPFVLLVHGDLWSNNILFKMDGSSSSEPESLKIIDFQEAMLSRPTTDLACLLLTSITPELRRSKTWDFLRFYHGHLSSQLKIYGYRGDEYSWEQLEDDYPRSIGHGFYWAICNAWGHATKDDLAHVMTAGDKEEEEEIVFKKGNLPDGARRMVTLVEDAAEMGLF